MYSSNVAGQLCINILVLSVHSFSKLAIRFSIFSRKKWRKFAQLVLTGSFLGLANRDGLSQFSLTVVLIAPRHLWA